MTLTISDSFKALFQHFNFMSSGNSCSVELSMKKVNNFGGGFTSALTGYNM